MHKRRIYSGIASLVVVGSLTPLQAHAAAITSASASSKSTQATTTGSGYTPLSPVRILDTRKGIGARAAKVPAFGTVSLKVVGTDGVPSGVTAVALNITVVNPTQTGYITAYAGGQAKPWISNLNFKPGQTVPNTAIVQVGANGYVNFANGSGGTVDLLADLAGYYSTTSPDLYWPLYPGQLLDTRGGNGTLPANGVVKLKMTDGSLAVNLNIIATNPQQTGYITAYPDGGSRPTASNVNFTPGQTVANGATVQVGADGYVDFVNGSGGSVDLIVQFSGSFINGTGATDPVFTRYYPITPTRVLDSRAATPVAPGRTISYGAGQAVAANYTVTHPTAGGYLEVYPGEDDGLRGIFVVEFSPNQTVANANTMTSQAGVDITNQSAGSTDIIVDEFGYYA